MQKIAIIALILIIGASASNLGEQYSQLRTLWSSWKQLYNKDYENSLEDEIRFGIFVSNYEFIQKWNSENNTCTLALNKFSDLSSEEFGALYTGAIPAPEDVVMANLADDVEPGDNTDYFDWTDKGMVTAVKNQGQCGSCWAFSTIATLESLNAIQGNTLYQFSEQELVDCVNTCYGCNGGIPYLAFIFTESYGVEYENDYPYQGVTGQCQYDSSKAFVVNKGYQFVKPGNPSALMAAILINPTSVIIEADQQIFQSYSSGVIGAGCGASLDHAVTATGYQNVNGDYAIIIKNSWGSDWGDNGYVFISSNTQYNNGLGACGVLSQPSYPTP